MHNNADPDLQANDGNTAFDLAGNSCIIEYYKIVN